MRASTNSTSLLESFGIPRLIINIISKQLFNRDSFQREVDSLLRIRRHRSSSELRTSRLAGVVKWDDRDSIMDLLLEFVENRGDMSFMLDEGVS
jgi:hypothetical protein